MVGRVPIIEQCTVSSGVNGDVTVERLSDYLVRNKNLVFPHRHNFYHFLLFTAGAGQHTIDFEAFEIEKWQIYFMSPGQIHTWSFEGEMQGYVVNFDKDLFKTLLINPDYLSLFSFFSGLVKDEVFVVDVDKREVVGNVLEKMLEYQGDKGIVSASLLYLFHLLESDKVRDSTFEANRYNHTLLRNFLQLIELNYRELRLPKDYAALLYITPNHLNALCRELLGMSAGEVIRDRVILEAKRLLVIRNFSIAEIAYELNFNDNSYFTKFFKKIEGLTPEEFRKKNYNYGK
ncbi:helix-turn-helix domain-containing protein [Sphingobacterium yanglingense]|uniref:AraC-like DNA-binding protein n=1 Tax=Sphingobacterium yanglingense TaxID=1437280 RepID=A0A4R6W9Q2_9SPHI|nr:AraC family transcriptional regulator [Sphingobacterium yanglingense]TDQ75925.1 AraC-like DNA-binding protein [Sphingobacterium yanglingense]